MGRPGVDPSTMGFLQLASYGDRGNAERMLQKLQQAGIEHAELISVQVADQTWWRVHIGPIRADESERLAAHLDELGFGTPPFFKE
jgi:rare lipoprotein A